MHTDPHFGASLYVPAVRADIREIAEGKKLTEVRTVIFCMEDAVANHELELAQANIRNAIPCIQKIPGRRRFIRPRSADSLRQLLKIPGIENIDGFVLPKFSPENAAEYKSILEGMTFLAMPTLETVHLFDDHDARQLKEAVVDFAQGVAVSALRIGGNDLLSLIGVRRPRGLTIYDTPVGDVISKLVRTYKPIGFQLTAPTSEYFEDDQGLADELRLDIAHGLCGKTAIHTRQVETIDNFFRVTDSDVEAAHQILDPSMPGVFNLQGEMCEPATQKIWAREVLMRKQYFGS